MNVKVCLRLRLRELLERCQEIGTLSKAGMGEGLVRSEDGQRVGTSRQNSSRPYDSLTEVRALSLEEVQNVLYPTKYPVKVT